MKDDAKILGVFAKKEKIVVGLGTTAREHEQVTYWFATRRPDDQYEVRPLNVNHVPTGAGQIVSKGEFILNYVPDTGYYEKRTLPHLESLKARLAKGKKSLDAGKLDEAEKEFLKALLIDEENVEAVLGLGSVYCLKKDEAGLKKTFGRLLNIDAVFSEDQRFLFNNFGVTLRKQKYYEEALAYYGQAVETYGGDEHLRFNIARVQYELGRREACMEQLKTALTLNPEFREAASFLAFCRKNAHTEIDDAS